MRLQDCVSDHFLADTALTDNYDKLRVDFYFPVIDTVPADLRERFQGKNKVIMDGVAALQFPAPSSSSVPTESVQAVAQFATASVQPLWCLCQEMCNSV